MTDPTTMLPPTPGGRVFRHHAQPGLGDVTPSGRARLDAVARWLQDAAWADVADSGIPDDGVWVVRRLGLAVARFPRFWEPLEVDTFCSGTGALWAERRTTVGGGDVEAVALWVHLDRDGRPRPLPDGFQAVYGPAANGRRVRARLRHPPAPPPEATSAPWWFRGADLDLADHVNNAVYWAVLEEELGGAEPATPFRATIEHRAPGARGDARVAAAGAHRWILQRSGEEREARGRSGGDVLATLALDG